MLLSPDPISSRIQQYTASEESNALHRKRPNSSVGKTSVVIQHNYHDHADDLPPPHVDEESLNSELRATDPFPVRLQFILQQIEADGLGHIVSWQPHGRCFVVKQPDAFKTIFPKYFNFSKIASFQRQLNLYGFQRITQGIDKGGYYHELFLRGKIFLAHQIIRMRIKGTKVRARSNPDQEPDFWTMGWIESSRFTEVNKGRHAEAVPASSLPDPVSTLRTTKIVGTEPERVSLLANSSLQQALTFGSQKSSAKSSKVIECKDERDFFERLDESELLTSWGRSFFALDDLPDDLSTAQNFPLSMSRCVDLVVASPTSPSTSPQSMPTNFGWRTSSCILDDLIRDLERSDQLLDEVTRIERTYMSLADILDDIRNL